MIPIDNSVAGRVADIHHLMPQSGLHIVAEWFLPVQHQLMATEGREPENDQDGREPRARARSVPQHHPQARHQGGGRRRHGRRRARGGGGGRHLARRVGDRAGGENLRPANPQKRCRGRQTQHHALRRAGAQAEMGETRQEAVVTTFLFEVRNIPAALYKALGGFASNSINMTKLESYMVNGSFAATQFYADVEGHPRRASAGAGAGRTGILLAAKSAEDSRRLSGASVSRDVQIECDPGRRRRAGKPRMQTRIQAMSQ